MYTDEMRQAVAACKHMCPPDFTVDILDFDEFLAVTYYIEQARQQDAKGTWRQCAEYLATVLTELRKITSAVTLFPMDGYPNDNLAN